MDLERTKPWSVTDFPMQEQAEFHVRMWIRANVTKKRLKKDDVFVVWFCKTLQNWKALITTTLPNGLYFEVTHDGDKRLTYIDVYKKSDQIIVPE